MLPLYSSAISSKCFIDLLPCWPFVFFEIQESLYLSLSCGSAFLSPGLFRPWHVLHVSFCSTISVCCATMHVKVFIFFPKLREHWLLSAASKTLPADNKNTSFFILVIENPFHSKRNWLHCFWSSLKCDKMINVEVVCYILGLSPWL